MKVFLLVLFGIVGGVLGGMGMGGGTLLIPLLTFGLSISQQSAQAINLIAFLPMSVVALIIHSKNHLVRYKTAIPIAITGVISSVFGAMLATKLDSQNLSTYFAIFLILIGLFQFCSIWIFHRKIDDKKNS